MACMPISTQNPLRLVVSIDVEEEGLFAREYHCTQRPVSNVASLLELAPFLNDVPLTLFCAHAVFSDAAACRVIAHMRDAHGAEVAAHLHHWNTPPVQAEHAGVPILYGSDAVSTALVPVDTMARKLEELFAAARTFQGADVTSFRMGRWDLRHEHWPLLAQLGVRVDASVRPLHTGRGLGHSPVSPPDHFMAPREPYGVRVGERQVWEVPLTTTPLLWGLADLANALGTASKTSLSARAESLPTPQNAKPPPMAALAGAAFRASVQKWGALTVLPIYQPLCLLKLATLAHVWAGGRTLSLTWHSSETMPQGAPHMPTKAAVDAFLHKMRLYIQWLRATWPVECLTMAALGAQLSAEQGNCDSSYKSSTVEQCPPALPQDGHTRQATHVDWTYAV